MYYYPKLKEIRKEENLSQQQIADKLEMKQQAYDRYERGAIEIPLHHIITLAKFYGTTIDYLVEGAEIK